MIAEGNQIKVEILSCPSIAELSALVVHIWNKSRNMLSPGVEPGSNPAAQDFCELVDRSEPGHVFADAVHAKAEELLRMPGIPFGRMAIVTFEAWLPVALREQLIRHDYMVAHTDTAPRQDYAFAWVQSSRATNLESFEQFEFDWQGDGSAKMVYDRAHDQIRNHYGILVDQYRYLHTANLYGHRRWSDLTEAEKKRVDQHVPWERFRFIPESRMHLGFYSLTLEQLLHIFKKRHCGVSQDDFWGPFRAEMLRELEGRNPLIAKLMDQRPCSGGKCPYQLINEERKQGLDPFPVCPVYETLEG